MVASWEIKRDNAVLCAILHTETTTVAWAFGLRHLHIPGQIMPVTGLPFDHARNSAVQHMLNLGLPDWIFFLDSDVVPPPDTILRLMAHNQPIVSGIYCRRSNPVAIPVMIKDKQWVTQYPENTLFEVDLVGAGCLLIHKSVFSRLPRQDRPGHPWFDWRVNLQGIQGVDVDSCLSEDFTFCHHARKHGYKILIDTSIMCRHIGFGESTYGQFGPLNTIPMM